MVNQLTYTGNQLAPLFFPFSLVLLFQSTHELLVGRGLIYAHSLGNFWLRFIIYNF